MSGDRPIRLTWVQPEDLVGHELRQAGEDGRGAQAAPIADRWHAAGGHDAPPRAGASPEPPAPELRALAAELLDELAGIPSPLPEPTGLAGIRAAASAWAASGTPDSAATLARAGSGVPDSAATLARAASGAPERPGAHPDELGERLLGAWRGRAAGCVLGKPVEKIPRQGIREIAEATGNWPIRGWFTAEGLPAEVAARWPWNRRSAATSLAETLDGVPEDDDLNFPLLALSLLERHGRGFTTADVAALWLEELPAGRVFTAERVAYRNLLDGLEPPRTATWRNPFREWIGALIRADVYGWANPGDVRTAAEFAWRDARLSHTANGVYGAMMVAAMCARSLVVPSGDPAAAVEEVVAAGLSVVPAGSRLSRAVRDAVADARAEPDFERVVDRLYERHGGLHWVHTVNNAALVAAALTHGRGDFTASVAGAVAAGWDTDSAGATVGSIAGGLLGASRIPSGWALGDRLASSVRGFDGIGFDELTRRTLAVAS
ncbi:ADP-ribosylglycohydrolase family protein [Sphaerisporangium sp. NPDC005289]|uniref:ADP-ribosylglycohydrolase family protein n=1 Tax=Sphaerisporangium sp. NPDC005289 TaxID=3155247 RepID=UPI0033A90BD7